MAPIAADKIFIAQPFWIQRRISPDIAGWWDFFARRHARRLSMLERDALHSLNASLMQAERSSAEGNSASAVTAMPGQRNRELQSLCIANRVHDFLFVVRGRRYRPAQRYDALAGEQR